jgi:hypothetical protein
MFQKIKIKSEIAEGKKFSKFILKTFAFIIAFLFLTGIVGAKSPVKDLNITTTRSSQSTLSQLDKEVKDEPNSIKNKTKEEQVAQVKEILNSVDVEVLIEATK